ncbi:hypothetical protein ZWY2020_000112 [Hordeum vulgare]|nr:hypothetical protein ZWY2020_000112 [Hordeum vulgare]
MPDPAASLFARMGGMVLMDKEAEGLVFAKAEQTQSRKGRWAVVGKSCSPKPLNISILERTMQRAWGLHKEAKFRDLDHNVFEVHFGSEGDWKHVLYNGPWQFDFSVLVIKNYEGDTRPSEMVFDKIEVWFQVHDLPPDMRTEELGKALGNWMGEVVRVDVDKDGVARSNQLQWILRNNAGWLRSSLGKQGSAKEGSYGAGGGSSKTGDTEHGRHGHEERKGNPTNRDLQAEFAHSASSRTGAEPSVVRGVRLSSQLSTGKDSNGKDRDLRNELEKRREKDLSSKLVEDRRGSGSAGDRGVVNRQVQNDHSPAPLDVKPRKPNEDTGSRLGEANNRRRGHYVRKT